MTVTGPRVHVNLKVDRKDPGRKGHFLFEINFYSRRQPLQNEICPQSHLNFGAVTSIKIVTSSAYCKIFIWLPNTKIPRTTREILLMRIAIISAQNINKYKGSGGNPFLIPALEIWGGWKRKNTHCCKPTKRR